MSNLCDSIDPTYPAGAPCALHSAHRGKCFNGVAHWWPTGLCTDSPELPYLIAESTVPEDVLAARCLARATEQAKRSRRDK